MFKNKTVFVVGAGGSFEVGLPIGDGLALNIADKLNFKSGSEGGDYEIDQAMQMMVGARYTRDMVPWYDASHRISRSMPLALSIDNYLHTHSNDEIVVKIGKLAIARCILEAERNSDLYVGPHQQFDFHALHQVYRNKNRYPSWHNTFFKMLTENVKRDGLENVFENITIITFNYDRCIEHYLVHAFAQFMGMTLDESRALCGTLEIIHPYGKVGDYFGGETFTYFGDSLDRTRLFQISQQIRTFTEQVTEQDTIELMRRRLSAAYNVVFLGFSYGEMNLDLLKARGDREFKTVIGTALDVSDSNKSHYDQRLRQVLKLESVHNMPIHLQNRTCFQLINDFSRKLLS